MAGAGDVNGDGFADLLVGANSTDQGKESNTGTAYLVYGSAALSDTKLLGEVASDRAGFSVAGAGDVNGDGFDDILVGASGNEGTAYLLHGPVATGTLELADADLRTPNPSDGRTALVAGGGDVDGDGLDDVLMAFTGREVVLFLIR
ncbi:MAG: VCBS repeat-containing protein [Myxococcota bacterium]